jgi:uncharacterized membrane protein YhaH (DUF805 family)
MRHLFLNLDGRISRKTFWLASLGVLVTGFVIAAIAVAQKLAGEVARDMAVEGVVLLFLLPYFMLAVKRGHDRNISTWIVSGWFVLVATTDALDFFGWLPSGDDLSKSGPFLLAAIWVTGIVGLALLVELYFRRGTSGLNRYGPDPLSKLTPSLNLKPASP